MMINNNCRCYSYSLSLNSVYQFRNLGYLQCLEIELIYNNTQRFINTIVHTCTCTGLQICRRRAKESMADIPMRVWKRPLRGRSMEAPPHPTPNKYKFILGWAIIGGISVFQGYFYSITPTYDKKDTSLVNISILFQITQGHCRAII